MVVSLGKHYLQDLVSWSWAETKYRAFSAVGWLSLHRVRHAALYHKVKYNIDLNFKIDKYPVYVYLWIYLCICSFIYCNPQLVREIFFHLYLKLSSTQSLKMNFDGLRQNQHDSQNKRALNYFTLYEVK